MIDCSLGDDGIANPGDTCTYSCDDDYMVDGDMTVTCGDDGTWSDDTTCILIGMVYLISGRVLHVRTFYLQIALFKLLSQQFN